MYSDDEEAEIAVDIRRLWNTKVVSSSAGRRDVPKPPPASARPKEPFVVATHYDPDRRRLYYGLDDGAVCFWSLSPDNAPNAHATRFVGAHKGPISAIATPRRCDGDLGKAGLIVTGSVDASIKIWDYQGKVIMDPTVCVQTLYGHSGTVTSLVILGDYIVSSSTDGSIKMWRQAEGRGQLVYPWFELQSTVTGMEGWVRCMTYDTSGDSGDLGTIFAADESGGMTKIVPEAVWDDSIQRLSTRMDFRVDSRVERLHDRGISILRFVAKWDLVLTVAYDQCIRAYDTRSETVRYCWANERQCQFTTLDINLEFDEILAGDTLGVLSIFSIRTGRLMVTKQLIRPAPAPYSGAPQRPPGSIVSPGSAGTSSATAVNSCAIHSVVGVLDRQLYAVVTARELSMWRIEHELDYNIARGGHEKAVISLYSCSGGVAGPGGDLDFRIFSASLDNTVRLWDPYDMACIRVMEEASSEISAMTFFEGWNLVVTGHDNGDVRLWNLDTSAAVTLRQHANTVTALALALVHRNEELLISASYDGWVVLWDIRSLRGEPPHMVAKFRAHGPEAAGAAGRHAHAHGLMGHGLGTMGHSGQPLNGAGISAPPSQRGSTSGATAGGTGTGMMAPGTAAGAGGTGLVAAGAGHSAADALRRVLAGPEPEILALKYDPLKKAIVTAGTDRVIKVWAATGYEYLGCHSGHREPVTCLALDSNFLFSGSDDCSICLWDTVPAAAGKAAFTGTRPAGAGFGTSGGHSSGGGGPPPPPPADPSLAPAPSLYKAPFSSRPLKTLTGHTRSVTGLDVLPASGNLVSCSLDGQLLVWDYVAGQVLHRFAHDTEEFRCLALRYDRAEVLVGTQQASLLRYALHEPSIAARGTSARGAGRMAGAAGQDGSVHGDFDRLALDGSD